MSDDNQPKIVVDDDWKSEARREKEKLAETAAASKEAEAGAAGAADGAPVDPNKPLDFLDLVRMLATQALMYLGAFPDPQTGKAMVGLDVAKMNIDLLAVLAEKTKGNLNEDEEKMLSGTLYELQTQFVEIARAVSKAQEEGRIGADGAIAPPPGAEGTGGMPGGMPGANPSGPLG